MCSFSGRVNRFSAIVFLGALLIGAAVPLCARAAPSLPSDIAFVTQVPVPADSTNVLSAFGNHKAAMESAPRGGDLYIRYRDGTLKNITAAAGYGASGAQGDGAIAVRDPCVHWDGGKILFSMVVGAPRQNETTAYAWQLYEVSGLGKSDVPVISKVPGQPAGYNNVMPAYAADDRILFISDYPPGGAAHLYPQRDEALSDQAASGLWSLDPASGELFPLDRSPSGAFKPFVDSYGRVLMTRWDHLQRDQLGDDTDDNGAFNYSDERSDAYRLLSREELFPEPRSASQKIAGLNLHTFNHFFPWQLNQDGTELETLNHIGRHELIDAFRRSFTDDPELEDFAVTPAAFNPRRIDNFFQIREDPLVPGRLFGVDAPQFNSHGAGQIISVDAPPTTTADLMSVSYITARETHALSSAPSPAHSGLYRDPLPLSDGTLIAAHTAYTDADTNDRTRAEPCSRYDFRLTTVEPTGGARSAGSLLTGGISKSVSYFDPAVLVSYSGPLWELQPVEIRARVRPAAHLSMLEAPETAAFTTAGVDPSAFKAFLSANGLALAVSRNVTTRDAADQQQPYNLAVSGSPTRTVGDAGKVYSVRYLQFMEGELLRGYGGAERPIAGRRILAQPLHEPAVRNPPVVGGPPGAVSVAEDGSIAAFVPARRALTWQLLAPDGTPVVRERFWLTMQPGEIRVCTSCHGLNRFDQAGNDKPMNTPQALIDLLRYWKQTSAEPPRVKVAVGRGPVNSVRSLHFGDTVRFSLQSLNDAAASRAFDIVLSAGRFACKAPISHLWTGADGAAVRQFTIPKLSSLRSSRDIPVRLSVLFEHTPLAQLRLRLDGRGRRLVRRSPSARQVTRLCRRLAVTA